MGISVAPEFPTQVEVGDTNVPASLTITNNSDGDEAVGNVNVTNITFVPSCSRALSSDPTCSIPPSVRDPQTFDLSATGTGQAGTACAGQTFTITETPAGSGLYTITPTAGNVVLGPPNLGDDTDMCRILFTFDVVKVPNADQNAVTPGVQTAQLATVDAIHDNGTPGGGFGADTTSVLAAATALTTDATDGNELGGPISDTATLSGGGTGVGAPTGTITFNLYGPNDATCAGAPVFTSVVPVAGNGAYNSGNFVPTAPGTYRWTAVYGGDANNLAVTSPCNAANEISQIIDIVIVKEASPASMPAPGGDFTFSLVITNPSAVPVTITSLNDDIYGNVATIPEPNTCNDLIGTTLAPGASTAPCTFVGEFTSNTIGASQTDTVTVVATDPVTGATATDDDPATVTLTAPGLPSILVDKTADPLQQVVPGGDFTFTVVVTNNGPVPVTITTLTDDVYGDLGGAANPDVEPNTCDTLIGSTLAPGASSAPCTFVGEFTNPTPASQTDVVTVAGVDQFGRPVTDNDDAVVELILPVPPQINVVKDASPATQEEPGGDFTFTVTVNNPGTIPITITSLNDDIYGDIGGAANPDVEPNTCDELIGDVLAPGATSAPCTFTAEFLGDAPESQTDTVTVVGTDEFGRTVTDFDDATVALTDAPPPSIIVDKTVQPGSLPVPGGDFTYTVVVTNNGVRPITITSLVDDVYGNLGTRPGANTCDDLIGDTLAVGASATCTFVGTFTNATPATEVDTVTVIGTDATGATATDSDDAEVTLFVPTAPQIDLVKTADPLTRTVPGGTFTFSLVVTNPGTIPGTIPVTITSLVDNVYGDLGTRPGVNTCDDLIGDVLAPGGSATCSFEGPFTGAAGATQTDIVVVTGTGNGQTVTADDDAIVALVAPPPLSILVDKTASPLSRPVPGGDFTFTVVVSNPGTTPVTITSLTDNVYGNLATLPDPNTCDALIGTVLAPGASSAPCTFTRPFTGGANASQTDIVTVIGTDQFGQTATDNDDATVTLTPVAAPQVSVDKTVTPASRVVPGGNFTFSVVVSNPGTVPVVITSLTDDIYGNLARAEHL